MHNKETEVEKNPKRLSTNSRKKAESSNTRLWSTKKKKIRNKKEIVVLIRQGDNTILSERDRERKTFAGEG